MFDNWWSESGLVIKYVYATTNDSETNVGADEEPAPSDAFAPTSPPQQTASSMTRH